MKTGMLTKEEREQNRETSLYCATNLVNGKQYIGITSGYVSQRKSKHLWVAKNNVGNAIFSKAIRKYGIDMFKFETLKTFENYSDASKEEIRLIAEWNPEYNVTKGGEGFLGCVPSQETRRKISIANKGKPGWLKGKKQLPHVIEAVRAASMKPEKREKWAKLRMMGPKSIQKKIICINDSLEFESINHAAIFYGLDGSSIAEVCKKKSNRRTCGGKVFRYYGDHLGGIEEAERESREAKKRQLDTARLGYRANMKRIICLDDSRVFSSIKEAGNFYGIHKGTINSVCQKKPFYHTAGGKKFAYVGVEYDGT